ncbi:MAG: ABC transporter ATP-binding protein [Pseudomonadota bacterium]
MPEEGVAFEARGLVAGYGGKPILDGLDLVLPKGKFIVLLGPNGSGKSTLLRTLGRLLPVSAGQISHEDHPIARLPAKALARRIAVLAQGPIAPEGLRVRDLVAQGRYPHRSLLGGWNDHDEAACKRALDLTGMVELADRPLDALSGGQRQRAWISMTLAQETGTLLLDEPTTYLDIAHQIEVLALLRRLVQEEGKSVVVVLHDINQAARYGDHIILLMSGKVVATGTPSEVLTPETLRAVFGIETLIVPDPETGAPLCIPKQDQSGAAEHAVSEPT